MVWISMYLWHWWFGRSKSVETVSRRQPAVKFYLRWRKWNRKSTSRLQLWNPANSGGSNFRSDTADTDPRRGLSFGEIVPLFSPPFCHGFGCVQCYRIWLEQSAFPVQTRVDFQRGEFNPIISCILYFHDFFSDHFFPDQNPARAQNEDLPNSRAFGI